MSVFDFNNLGTGSEEYDNCYCHTCNDGCDSSCDCVCNSVWIVSEEPLQKLFKAKAKKINLIVQSVKSHSL